MMNNVKKQNDLEEEIAKLLNKYSRENHSNTPDFILAEYLIGCLNVFEVASLERERWYGKWLGIKDKRETVFSVRRRGDHSVGKLFKKYDQAVRHKTRMNDESKNDLHFVTQHFLEDK